MKNTKHQVSRSNQGKRQKTISLLYRLIIPLTTLLFPSTLIIEIEMPNTVKIEIHRETLLNR